MSEFRPTLFLVVVGLLLLPAHARAADILCDSSFQSCRPALLTLIRNETVGIDVAFWFMEDTRYQVALIERFRAGVPVRVIVDTEANNRYTLNAQILAALRSAGIPMLEKTSSGIVHWKMMLFAGQNVVEFSGANFSPHAFNAQDPYRDYLDEVIAFVDDPAIVNSFKRKYDDVWLTTSGYTPYGNLSGTRQRHYPLYDIDPRMNFVPYQNFATRSVSQYNKETQRIDSTMFRITDVSHTNALIAAMNRGVSFRLITDEEEYRDPSRFWHAYNVDRLYAAALQICPATCGVRLEAHLGALHQKSTVLHGLGMTIFGSSNWTSPSARSQLEHNIFTTSPWWFQYFADQFERKWNNSNPIGAIETKPLVPKPPDVPLYVSPANAAQGQPLSLTLQWLGGLWAHKYDVYLGTDPTNMTVIGTDLPLGPSETPTDYGTFAISGLQDGTLYYWRIVSKTMANVQKSGPIWSFRTSGTAPEPPPPPPPGPLPAGWTARDIGAVGAAGSTSEESGVFTVQGAGADVWGAADAFQYAFAPLSGDGSITARVRSVAGSEAWTKVGVMIRNSTASNAAHAFMMVTTGKGLAFQRRTSNGALSTSTSGGAGTAPKWVRLTRTGTRIVAFVSSDGANWTQVGSDTFVMSANVLAGLAVSGHDAALLGTGTFDSVSIEAGGPVPPPPPPDPLPAGWTARDIGGVGAAGSASEQNGVFTVSGAGADVWGTSDAFHFANRSLTGDGVITARVSHINGSQAWTKIGVMIRASTATNSAHAFMLVSVAKGLAFQRRPTTGGISTHTAGALATAPRWIRLTRAGNLITAYESMNGTAWTLVGSDTITLPSTVLMGLAVSSHTTSSVATGTFDNVSIAP
jgi:phosphatidylserine/phosphatidylglycerophosphate/cardiolipin synthase-like enzyme/regulation of enolase protein 1 (concanavalin A-like superfamily)